MTDLIHYDRGVDGIVVLTIDDPAHSANTINADFAAALGTAVDRLVAERDRIVGVVITSAKQTFIAGGDLNMMLAAKPEQALQVFDLGMTIKSRLRTLETLGKPVVAALNGTALGGGLEVALACHHRIAADVKGAQFGMPEVTLGLLPGGGGVVRTVRLLGISDALTKVLLRGTRFAARDALEVGLIDEIVDTVDDLLPAARAWIAAHPDAIQPWDVKGYRIPGGTPSSPAFAANLPAFPANLRKQLKGAHYPAPRAIMAAAVEGAQVDIDTAGEIEARYMTELVTGQVAKNMIQAFFFDLQQINSGGSRPPEPPKYTARKVGVLGAGMMGAGIAHVFAKAGLQVILKDVSIEVAEGGKAYSAGLLEKAVGRGQSTRDGADALLDRITATADAAELAGCDLVIEAVFESAELKHQVYAEIEGIVPADAVLASNTSSLPITELAAGVRKSENFIGLHFFSPVDKMPLLEIIAGQQTSDATLAKAFDIAQQIRKTPIVVNDSRGFFTSRVIGTFLHEAIAMLGEGVPAASIEQAGLQAGCPAAPLQLADELNLSLMSKIQQATQAAQEADGAAYFRHPAVDIIEKMIELGRTGRHDGAGFYDYTDGKRTGLWAGLADHFGAADGTATPADTGAGRSPGSAAGEAVPFQDLKERMLFAESLETEKCLDEGVLRTVEDANIGSILGIGFPGWTGGVVQYMDGYPGGLTRFVARARELAQQYGPQFTPPPSLVDRAASGSTFRSSFQSAPEAP